MLLNVIINTKKANKRMDIELIIGFVGAVLSSVSFLPQVIKIIKTKSADDLSMPTILLLAGNAAAWLTYGILKDALPLSITNAIMLSMLLLIVFFKIKFRPKTL